MTVIKKVDPVSLAKIQGLIGVVFGLVGGVFMGLFGTMMGSLAGYGGEYGAGGFGAMMYGGIAAIFFLPVLYGIVGFVAGLVGGWVYNVVAKWVGGIEIDLEQK